jgi:two-component system response regulator GlrR
MTKTDKARILLVEDDPGLSKLLSIRLSAEGYQVECASNGDEALSMMRRFHADLVISDLRMDGMDGLTLLTELHRDRPSLPVLIITAHGTIPDAVQATRSGAFDFIPKPINKDQLLEQVERALQVANISPGTEEWRAEIITSSPKMLEVLEDARLVAGSETSVLITGASGTGKELLARAIHRASSRHEQPFVAINCGAMPENLLESELFGHTRGAFTGAVRDHAGLFRTANNGTIFLDEIGDMPLPLQIKLLRVLQERVIRPVGGTESIQVDVRVISATHRDLRAAMLEGKFREDLYYRLNVVSLHLPSLSERASDIPLLVSHFLRQLSLRYGGQQKVYAPEAMELLVAADWPGNIRHLYNVVEQNVALSPTPVITAQLVQKAVGEQSGKLPSFAQARDEFTRAYLTQLLQITGGNVSHAARLAERNRTQFYKLLSRYGLAPADFKASDDDSSSDDDSEIQEETAT